MADHSLRSTPLCGLCGKEAEGFATINGVRYCHEGPDPTCYMRQQQTLFGIGRLIVEANKRGISG